MPRSKYNKRSKSWITSHCEGWKIQSHLVEWDEARDEIGIHLMDCEIRSSRYWGAVEDAEKHGFTRIFIHKYPENVIKFERKAV